MRTLPPVGGYTRPYVPQQMDSSARPQFHTFFSRGPLQQEAHKLSPYGHQNGHAPTLTTGHLAHQHPLHASHNRPSHSVPAATAVVPSITSRPGEGTFNGTGKPPTLSRSPLLSPVHGRSPTVSRGVSPDTTSATGFSDQTTTTTTTLNAFGLPTRQRTYKVRLPLEYGTGKGEDDQRKPSIWKRTPSSDPDGHPGATELQYPDARSKSPHPEETDGKFEMPGSIEVSGIVDRQSRPSLLFLSEEMMA